MKFIDNIIQLSYSHAIFIKETIYNKHPNVFSNTPIPFIITISLQSNF